MSQGLTDRQREVLDFIYAHTLEHGYQPSIREIGAHLGTSGTNGVADHLVALEKKGHISRGRVTARALRLADWPNRLRQHAKAHDKGRLG